MPSRQLEALVSDLDFNHTTTTTIGRFQVMSTTTLISGFLTGSFLAYSISFLELNPKYICKSPGSAEFVCTRDDFCDKPDITHYVDWNDESSLHNWIESLDLTCTPKA